MPSLSSLSKASICAVSAANYVVKAFLLDKKTTKIDLVVSLPGIRQVFLFLFFITISTNHYTIFPK